MLRLVLSFFLLATPCMAKPFTWSYTSDVQTLDPHVSRVSFTNAFLANVYETLVRMDDRLAIQPALATDWEQPSPTVWRFRIRTGVRFHNGDPFTADDVVFSWERLGTPGANRGAMAAVKSIRAVGDDTIEVETIRPYPLMLNALLQFPIMGRAWSVANGAALASDLVGNVENFASGHENGTGPFRIVSRQPDGPTVLEPFGGWWDEPKHNLDRVTYLPLRNAATRTASLISGAIDATTELPLQDVDRVRASPALEVVQGPELRTIYIGMDQFRDELLYSDVKGRNPLKDHRVREALYRAIDIAAIRHVIMRDQSWPAGFMASRQLNGAPQDLNERLGFDPDRARTLLTEAGFPSGFGITLTCPNDRYVNDERICQAIAAMWTKVGVRTAVQSETTAIWSRRTATFDVSVFMLGHAALPLADAYSTLADVLHSRTATMGGLNAGRFSDPGVDRATERTGEETDPAKRAADMREAFLQEKQDIGHIPLHQQPLTWAARKGIALHQAPDNAMRLWLVRID